MKGIGSGSPPEPSLRREQAGQLGDIDGVDTPFPREVPGLTDVESVSAGVDHNCALTRSGEVWCWGRNWYGQLGDGTMSQRSRPVRALLP